MKTDLIQLPLYWLSTLSVEPRSPWNIVKVAFGKNNTNHQVLNNDTLKIFYPRGSYSPSKIPQGGVGFFASPRNVFMSEEVILRYEMFWNDTFNPVLGGKLPGLFLGKGTRAKDTQGASGGKYNANSASVRMAWRKESGSGIPGEAYVYLPKGLQTDAYYKSPSLIENGMYGDSLWRGLFTFYKGVWNNVTMRVKLNQINKLDGELEVAVNGVYHHIENLVWRTSADVFVNSIIFETFFGGSSIKYATPIDTWSYFRNVYVQSLR